jgi:uncharacterized protein YjeT (DUF2065 family)
MSDFVVAIGLVFALEGLFFAAFPTLARRAMREAAEQGEQTLRLVGLISAICGVAAIWIARHF